MTLGHDGGREHNRIAQAKISPFSDITAKLVAMSENGETCSRRSRYSAIMKLDNETCYRALAARDVRFDGLFFVGVTTTGIYCRPICPARTPGSDRCRFFPNAAMAEQAGFRPCLRCRPELAPGHAPVDAVGRTARLAGARIETGGAQWRRQPGVARPRAWPQLATAPASDPPGVRRLAGRAGSNVPPPAGEEVDRRDEFAPDRGRPGQRLRQRSPVQRPLPLSLLDDPLAHAAGLGHQPRSRDAHADACLSPSASLGSHAALHGRQSRKRRRKRDRSVLRAYRAPG